MKLFSIALVLLLLVFALYIYLICPRIWKRPDYSVLKGFHYAHRGLFDNKSDAPENSLAAFEKAIKSGYGIEFDVQLSKDKIPVIFHDADLKRMCGIEGNVWDYTFDELQQMKLSTSQQTIPGFQEALNLIHGQVPLIIEYKLDRVSTEVCQICNEILKNYKGIYCIESFHPLAVSWYKKNRPDIIRGQLSQNFAKNKQHKGKHHMWILSHLLTNVLCRPDFIAYKHKDANMLSRRLCRRLGGLSVAYTIKNQEQYEKVKDQFELFIFDSFYLESSK